MQNIDWEIYVSKKKEYRILEYTLSNLLNYSPSAYWNIQYQICMKNSDIDCSIQLTRRKCTIKLMRFKCYWFLQNWAWNVDWEQGNTVYITKCGSFQFQKSGRLETLNCRRQRDPQKLWEIPTWSQHLPESVETFPTPKIKNMAASLGAYLFYKLELPHVYGINIRLGTEKYYTINLSTWNLSTQ